MYSQAPNLYIYMGHENCMMDVDFRFL